VRRKPYLPVLETSGYAAEQMKTRKNRCNLESNLSIVYDSSLLRNGLDIMSPKSHHFRGILSPIPHKR